MLPDFATAVLFLVSSQAPSVCLSGKQRVDEDEELGGNDTDKRKQKYSKKNLPHCHFVHHKTHMDSPGFEPGLRDDRSATNRFT